MKTKNNLLYRMSVHFALWLSLLVVSACDSFVEVPPPDSQLNSGAVFADYTTATAAMKDVYAKMRDTGLLNGNLNGLTHLLGQYTDELTCHQNGIGTAEPFYTNTLTVTNTTVQELWSSAYSQIYAVNSVLEGVQNSTALSDHQKKQLTGEALFVRALLHSYLSGVFGGCPYVTSTDYQQNSTVSRLSQQDVYFRCIADLEQSALLLSVDYLSADRFRPNQSAAKALLARMYLYTSQWDAASNAASAVLNETSLYVWETDLDKTFLKNCTSTIWQFAAGGNFDNTQEGSLFVFDVGPPVTVSLSSLLYNSFETGDLRKVQWIRSVTNGSQTWYHAYKYKQGTVGTATNECSIQLRLAEQYLIRAEARAYAGDLIGAQEDLNVVRNRAGLGNTTATTSSSLVAAVLKERQAELFAEQGHRFFDLQRSSTLDIALNAVKPGWSSSDAFWPVPQSELLINPNLLPQNDGY